MHYNICIIVLCDLYYSAAAFRRTRVRGLCRSAASAVHYTAVDVFRLLPVPEEAVKFIISNFKTVYYK